MTVAVAPDVIEDEFQLSAPGLDKTRSYRYLGGVELGEKAFISGRFLAGMRDFPASSSGSLPTYRGPAYQAELRLPLFNRLRLVGTLLRDVYVSAVAVRTAEERARNTYVMTQLNGSADIDLPLDLIGRASVGFTEASYLLPRRSRASVPALTSLLGRRGASCAVSPTSSASGQPSPTTAG
jgi:hypothetical protein